MVKCRASPQAAVLNQQTKVAVLGWAKKVAPQELNKLSKTKIKQNKKIVLYFVNTFKMHVLNLHYFAFRRICCLHFL